MEIVYREGDLLQSAMPMLHGCNASGYAFNSGVAGQIRKKFPLAYSAYIAAHHSSRLRIGDLIIALDGATLIFNGITQERFGPKGTGQYVDYDAIRMVIRRIDQFAAATQDGSYSIDLIGKIHSVAMPKIGSDLGGGSWDTIAGIIAQESRHFQPIVYVLPNSR